MIAILAPPSVPSTTNPDDFIRCLPWSSPPPGVTITQFKDYSYAASKKEAGIKVTCPDDIPTVALEHRPATDKSKADAFRGDKEDEDILKLKKPKIKTSVITGDVTYEWPSWAEEDTGAFIAPYDRKTPAIDRLCQAATDFRASGTWPQGDPRQLSPTKLFDQFGVFIGVQAIIPTGIRDDPDVTPPLPAAVEQQTESDRTVDPKNNEDKDEAAAIQEENEPKDGRLLAFLEYPETTVKMFLSSYMRKEGLVWSDPNLTNTPRVIFFFIRFILRNKLLPEYEAGLKKALAVVERAQIELPRTSVVSKLLPCEVSLALRDQYGSKAAQFRLIIDDVTKEEEPGTLQEGSIDLDANGQWDDDDDILDTDHDDPPPLEEPIAEYLRDRKYVDAEQPVDEDEEITNIEEVVEGGTETDAATTYPSDESTSSSTTATDNGWNDNGWGDAATDVESSADGGWGDVATDVESGDDNGPGNANDGGVWWDNKNDTSTVAVTNGETSPTMDWMSPTYNLQNFLGIDALPESYSTGVVEESVRKIISVHGPDEKKIDPAITDDALEAKFGRIVLAPWNDWDIPQEGKGLSELRRVYSEIYRGRRIEKENRRFDLDKDAEEGAGEEDNQVFNTEEVYEEEEYEQKYSESTNAKIVWESSVGWVVDPDTVADEGDVLYSNCTYEKPAMAEVVSEKNKKVLGVHDPAQDTIEVLVDPAVIESLKDVVGLGLGGTFVQLVYDGKEETTRKYWYADKLPLVIPSFYIS